MPGATARYTIMPVTQVSADEARAMLAGAARRISEMTAADADSIVLLARLSLQIAEATRVLEDAQPGEIAVAAIYAAGQSSRVPALRLAPPLRESSQSPRAPSLES